MPRLSKAELAARHLGLGATDVVEALGLAPWQGAGPMRLYLDKTGQAEERERDPEREAALDWGHAMETLLADWYESSRTVKTLLGGHVPHREIPWLWATLDRKAPDRIVEIKHVGAGMAHHWDASAEDGVPRYVRAQVTIGMACLGARLCDVVADVAGRPPHVWTVAWDEELWEAIREGAARFWALVQARTPPPLDATDATKEMLRRKWPGGEDRVVLAADFLVEDIAARRVEAAIEECKWKTKKILADVELMDRVGNAQGIRGEGWSFTHKTDKSGKRRTRFTAAALRDE